MTKQKGKGLRLLTGIVTGVFTLALVLGVLPSGSLAVSAGGEFEDTTVVSTGGADSGVISSAATDIATLGPISIREGDTPVEQGLNFGGKTFTFAYFGSGWDEDHSAKHADFQKQYNVKLDIEGVATSEYVAALSSAMAAGTPYDIVFLYGFDYPEQITANVMRPLNDYITTADLWDEDSATTGGFSKSLMQAHSFNGNIYSVAGNYLQTPTVLWYNKKIFADAGYDTFNDPYALYKAGKWSWEALYDMLLDIRDPERGLWGINSIAPYYDHQFINSFGTDFAKITTDGRVVQNLADPQLYKAYEMLQKYCYGEHKVTDPKNQFENGIDQFLNGTTASVIGTAGYYWTWYNSMSTKTYSAFGSKTEQLSNIGAVPIPNQNPNGTYSIWDWMGYGAGNGTTEEGVLCALAFAKHDSIVYHKQAYHPNMTAEMKALFTGILDSDNLIGPMDGFSSSAGSLGGIGTTISSAIALKGQNITVVLKGYEKVAQTVIDTALKTSGGGGSSTAPAVTSITAQPQKTVYGKGESFAKSDVVVTATYDDGSTETVSGFGYTVEDAEEGKAKVTISYRGISVSYTVSVYVEPVPTFSVNGATVKPGDTFTVDVSVKDNPGIVSMRVQVGYDANVLELVSTQGADFSDTSFGPPTANPISVNWFDTVNPNNTTSGTLAKLTFKVKEGAALGNTAITVDYDPEDVYDSDFNNVAFTTVNGTVKVVEYLPGDVTGDGRVNNKDLGMLLQHINGWDVEIIEAACDVTGDDRVNNKDLGILLQYLNGWDVELK